MEITTQAGDTIRFKLTIYSNKASNIKRDVSVPANYSVWLYDQNKQLIARYSKIAATDFIASLTTIAPASNGEINLTIEHSVSKKMKGVVYWQYFELVSSMGNEDNLWRNKTPLQKLMTVENNSSANSSSF